MDSIRPYVNVYNVDSNKKPEVVGKLAMPLIMQSPIRPDIVSFVFNCMLKNKRQPFGVKPGAGYDTSAASWGTGRAVSRIPRVSGGGTHRSAQGAFGNMCRGGGMYSPIKVWRRWHRHINLTQKRYALASAIASSSFPGLVMGRGHKIDNIPELPLVVSDEIQKYNATKDIYNFLVAFGCQDELSRVKENQKIKAGRGKSRNRRYTERAGPLIVYKDDDGLVNSCSNIPGVTTINVTRLNLLYLAPGGTLGRFVIWTHSAFLHLHNFYCQLTRKSEKIVIPKNIMINPDLNRIINSSEIQSLLKVESKKVSNKIKNKNLLRFKRLKMFVTPTSNE